MILRLLDRSYGISGIYYMLSVEERSKGQELIEFIASIAPKKKEEIMTAAKHLWNGGREEGREEGIKAGIAKGVQQSKLEIAKGMLRDHLSIEQISKWTGLDLNQIDMLK